MTRDEAFFDRWEEIDALFQAVLTRPPHERDSCLRELCTDPEIAGAVSRLLASTEEASGFLESVELPGGEDEAGADAQEIGRIVGRHRLVEVIGRGGTGTVYRATRVDGDFDQDVAIKVLRRGLDTDDVLARFRAERRILASLSHPHIGQLHDGGATEDGRPYLVMELVEGQPITEYCDSRRLDVDARLRLFVQVARAVQYAHRNLVVHRDLKPSNILVTQDGTPKLLDFGIAKLLDDAADAADAVHTRTGLRPMTPAYASPEQIAGDAITTASDVYQLGLLLYEILAGRRPFSAARATTDGAARSTTGDGVPPSGAILAPAPGSTDSAHAARIAELRGTDPRRLERRIRGDLDTVVLSAIRREPERRYASVEQFAGDIENFLKGLPVAAQPDTWRYRMGRRVRRNPALSAASALLVLLAAGYLVTATLYAGRLQAERDRARSEAVKAEQVTAFLMELFGANDPDRAAGTNPTALDLLEQGEAMAGRLAGQPAVQARMLNVLGQILTTLGQYDRAEPHFRQALDLSRRLGSDGEVALNLERLGDVFQRTGRYDEAEAMLAEAVEVARRAGNAELESDAHTDLGHSLHARGDYVGAEAAYREALAIRRRILGDQHARTAISIHNLALALEMQERRDEAESLYWQSLELNRGLLDPEHTQIALTLTTLARLYSSQDAHDRAEALLQEALEIYRNRLGPRHVRLGLVLNQLGFIRARTGDLPAAEAYFRESLEIHEAAFGGTHREVAGGLNNLSYVLFEQGKVRESIPLRQRTLAIARTTLGDAHENTGIFAHNLATALARVGDDAEAEALYREAAVVIARALGEEHVMVARPLAGLGGLLTRTGRAAEAEPVLRRALAIRMGAGAPAAATDEARALLDTALAALGRTSSAAEVAVPPTTTPD
ncbi:MAG TPA: serine/threonine-protein kinase [Longimicrobiales bacterium]|nr:serine/threonine-protein kinase [Longimicrobiales bacterium]